MKKIILRGSLIFISLIVIFGVIITITLSLNMREIRALPITDKTISSLEDGTYDGSYYYQEDQLGAHVEVTIKDGLIIDINLLEHITTRGQDAEEIIDDIITEQRIDVDAISGATTSSHVIKLAISDALEVE
ncbi:MAG: FMN-binding protein [Candidatus Izemoplasma sp.]|nr:FMN-binding protein [Candidatus Izemoplasma sp.]